ncbi:MAG: rod shape-determining protein MreD [Candidatus Omnitrophica bacterium]|nr:rod shape-determining protein MreD [Candidatus Omnitrophota bacterium]
MKNSIILTWIIVAAVLLLDISLRIFTGLGRFTPDLLLLALVYATLVRPLGEIYCLAFAAGVCWDVIFLDSLGLHSFLFILAVMFTSRLRQILWAHYAISRLVMGFSICGLVRFGEVIFWLSNLDKDVPVSMPEQYITSGAVISGLVFLFLPLYSKPIRIPRRSPQTVFAERYHHS